MERERSSGGMRRGNGGERGESREMSGGEPQREETGMTRRSQEYGGGGIHPLDLLRRYTREMDRVFDNFGMGAGGLGGLGGLMRWPAIEMFDRDNDLVIRVEMSGVRKEDVRVQVVGDTLLIEGERRLENEQGPRGVRRSEWSYGQFSREIRIPHGLDSEVLSARMRDGVLEIRIPYSEERRARDIEIQEDMPESGETRRSRRSGGGR
jgi:HSP20 family protein